MAVPPPPLDGPVRSAHGVRPANAAEALGAMTAAVSIVDAGGRHVFANDAHARLFGYSSPEDLVGRTWRSLLTEEALRRLDTEAAPELRRGGAWQGRVPARRRDGGTFPIELRLGALSGGGFVAMSRDVTEEQRAAERLGVLANRDALTGLPNRLLFDDRLGIALAQAHRYRHRLAVVFIDLDRFKATNDHLGRSGADELLKAVADRLRGCVREGDTVARQGGDEFSLLLPGIHYAEDLVKVSQKLVDALREPFTVGGREVRVTGSGGIALYPEDGEDAEALVKAADTAMYRAKERGRDSLQMYSAAMAAKASEREALELSLRSAIENREMTLHYQPSLDLADGRIVGFEALLRWQRPELGLVMPSDFIALADLTGAILSMGPWILEQAAAQAKAWHDAGRPDVWVSVNLTAFELHQPDLVRHVEKALLKSGLPAASFHLEIPEGYAMQNVDRTVETLRSLKALGVSIAVDGFGAGYSSLAHLRRLPLDTLKIDLSFVRGATSDPDDASVVTAVIAVAHSLKLRVVAQGVETDEQVALLRTLGCDEVQGYLWSPPVPGSQCQRLLKAGGFPVTRPAVSPKERRGRRRSRAAEGGRP
jgi:diguanylate cyclase (GGDEF)-like protein/PAS domain S-box-containing protein